MGGAQFTANVDLFKHIHPDCDLLFAFDNSMSHHKKAPGSLDVSRINLGDGGAYWDNAETVPMRVGWFINAEGVRIEQCMQNAEGKQLGLKNILIGRNKWRASPRMLKICDECKESSEETDRTDCCAYRVVSIEPDFLEQKEWLTEVVQEAGCSIIFYPKYHCELNFIENIWSYLKQTLRKDCSYSYADLKEKLPFVIADLSSSRIGLVRKMSSHAFKFMDLYRRGLDGPCLTIP
jgi:hypothetical protein